MSQPRRYLAGTPLAGSTVTPAPRDQIHLRQRERVLASLVALPGSPKPTHRRWG